MNQLSRIFAQQVQLIGHAIRGITRGWQHIAMICHNIKVVLFLIGELSRTFLTSVLQVVYDKNTMFNVFLAGGLEHVLFHTVGNVIIPNDELIFFIGVG